MRLIDADALIKIIENTYLEGDSNLSFRVDGATEDTLIGKFQTIDIISDMPTVCDIDAMRAEINNIFESEKDIDLPWALGLRYNLNIINKYIKE